MVSPSLMLVSIGQPLLVSSTGLGKVFVAVESWSENQVAGVAPPSKSHLNLILTRLARYTAKNRIPGGTQITIYMSPS